MKAMLKEAATVDLSFVMDTTGSMAAHMSSVKNYIQALVDNILATYPDIKLNLSFIGV